MGRRSSRIWILPAVGLPILAGWALVQTGGLSALLARHFGPPRMVGAEAYPPGDASVTYDHALLDGLLREFVDDSGYVDYAALAGRHDALRSYLDGLAAAPFAALGRDEKLALLINAYNAFTLELILDHAPVRSIRDIPSEQRWDAVRWNIAGRSYSLNGIEHEQIRPKFREPRIHFALVCAAKGCPPLRREAYTGERLEEQLEQQALLVHRGRPWIEYEPGADAIGLTRLYEWYAGDFEQVAGTVLGYVARYRERLDLASPPRIRYLDYDWTLNDRSVQPEE